jgi:hypothetical protein
MCMGCELDLSQYGETMNCAFRNRVLRTILGSTHKYKVAKETCILDNAGLQISCSSPIIAGTIK